MRRDYFVSLHHRIRLDQNLPPLGPLDTESVRLISGAAGVLMPKYTSPTRYREVASLASTHFPNLSARFTHRGKARQIELFRALGIPHPRTAIYLSPQDAAADRHRNGPAVRLPFVLKGDAGGGGSAVFPIRSRTDFLEALEILPQDGPVLVQEWIENQGRDLRVVRMGGLVKSYFRVGGACFYNNVSKGARIDFDLRPDQQKEGRAFALDLAVKAGIDVAAFDVMFPARGGPPLLLEINFLFGRKGLGGLKGYEQMFRAAVWDWMDGVRKRSRQQWFQK
ncbi:MAG: RimK family alpha-L-glutamate ligase [Desulfobacteraceae bacterium]